MPKSSGHIEFAFTHGSPGAARQRDPGEPLNILVLGDFGARWHRVLQEPLAGRPVYRVETDNYDDVLGSFGTLLTIPLAGEASGNARISPRSLDDFHPDTLLKKVPSLAELLAARKGLDSSTPHAAAEKVQSLLNLQTKPAPEPTTSPAAREVAGESTQETLARLLGQAPPAAPAPASGGGELTPQNIVQRILSSPGKPTPPPPPGLPGLITAADLELSARLRQLLHDADFQSVEAAWRGLDFLLRRCPDEEKLHYHVFDVSLDELAADPAGLHRLLRDQPWGAVVALFTFGETAADLQALTNLGTAAQALHTALFAGAHPHLVGCDSFDRHPDPDDWKQALPPDVAASWQALRASPGAGHVCLALPRFLLRQPYGKAGDAIERFAFEEMTDTSSHENFLWGNAGLLCAQLIAEGHAAGEPVAAGNLSDLAAGRYLAHGGTALKPCAEAWLVDRAAEAITRRGLVAVQSFKGRDAVQIPGLHAVCHPEKPSHLIG